jgi:thiamine-monophosphate kinase
LSDGRAIGEIGEHAFLERLCARFGFPADPSGPGRSVLLGVGDDCAIVDPARRPLALTTDALVEGVHFLPGWLSPAEIGVRAVMVSLSDLAAMGATPSYLLAAVVAPNRTPASHLDDLLDACKAASEAAGAALVGGNLTRGDRLSITVTAIGAVAGPWLARSGARPGDRLVVTGTLGGAGAAVACWLAGGEPAPALRDRFARPQARIDAGRTLAAAGAHAAIDLSDGLLADLGHLCAASGVGAHVERESLPRLAEVAALDAAGEDFAANGGEDYELLVALPESLRGRLEDLATDCGVALTEVGRCAPAAEGVHLIDASGRDRRPERRGFDHFAPDRGSDGLPERSIP